MKKLILKLLKWVGLSVLALIVLLVVTGAIFINTSPQFGGEVSEEQQIEYGKTGHYSEGVFLNKEEMDMELSIPNLYKMLGQIFNPHPNVEPKKDIKVEPFDLTKISARKDSSLRVTWLGHSSFIIEIDQQVILIDPIFSDYAAPHPWLGKKRYNSLMPFELNDLEYVDAVIISHDHYDHLDYPTINTLKEKVDQFFTPLGVGNHLREWGVSNEKINELDWWDEISFKNLKFVLTPSRHMSGRGLTDQSATLWGSWVILGNNEKIYFSGDGGYGDHFKTIGEKYGPFDLALMECGQYNKLWADVHMMPEQSVQAGKDVKAELIMPIHWGAFTLAAHSWTDPVERITKEAEKQNMPISTPKMGETLVLGRTIPISKWWELY